MTVPVFHSSVLRIRVRSVFNWRLRSVFFIRVIRVIRGLFLRCPAWKSSPHARSRTVRST